MQFDVVPAEKQADIIKPRRAAWFEALLESGMLKMASRPTLSAGQKEVLEAEGKRFRSRIIDDATYVWVEDIPSSDLSEAVDDDDLPLD